MINKNNFLFTFLFFAIFASAQNTFSYTTAQNNTCATVYDMGIINPPYFHTETNISVPYDTPDRALWYTFVGNGEHIFAKFKQQLYMSSLSVYKGNDCNNLTEVSYTQIPQYPCHYCYRTAIFQTEPGERYYFKLHAFSFADTIPLIITNSSLSTHEVLKEEFDISIYPNPATNYLQVKKQENIIDAEIISSEGKIIKKINNNFDKINVSDLAPGIYFLQLTDKKGEKNIKKFIKK